MQEVKCFLFYLLYFAAYCSSVLFSKDNGILRFMKEAASLEEFVGCKEKLLDLLSAFINILGEKIRPYALEIKVGRQCYTSPDGK